MFKRRAAAAIGLLLAVVGVVPSTVATTPAYAGDVANFRVGIQLIDDGGRREQGLLGLTPFLLDGGGQSPFTSDANRFDPDGARLFLNALTGEFSNALDFRIGAQALDGDGGTRPRVFTPWASQGGGSTGLVTDNNFFDPDFFQLTLQIRLLPPGAQVNDVRLSIAAFDVGVAGPTQFTPWLSQGGGFSPYAFDQNFFDPDGYIFGLQVA